VVYLRVSVLDLILVNYPYQVGLYIGSSEEFTLSFTSLRVNLDMGKTVYAHLIMKDNEIPGTIVRQALYQKNSAESSIFSATKREL